MNYDIIVIGSGPGGYVTAIRASQLGFKTAVIERENLGGICLNWGCIPTKALIKSAHVFDYIKHAEEYGLNKVEGSYEFSNIIKRSRGVADKMNKGIGFLMKKNKIDVILGNAKVKAGKKVDVTDSEGKVSEYSASHIIIATGARSRVLPNLPQDGKKIIGYREALTLPKQPKSMIVVGSGAIGIEFAYVYASLGTKVTVVEYLPTIVPVEDEEVSKHLEKSLKKQGIDIMTNASVEKVEDHGEGVRASIKTSQGEITLEAEIVLSAVGITANIENLGLENVGIATDKGRILVDDFYKTNVPGYYAIGDVIPGPALAHVASAEGILCVEKIKGLKVEPIDYGNIPGCTYCSPEIASVGMTEKKAKEAGYELKVGKFPFVASGKATANGDTDGFIKVIYDAKYGELLGCHMVGNGVTDMIAEAVAIRRLEATAHEVLTTIHPHPTISEAFKGATEAAYGEAIDL
ncbi:dihydrolipoyl dehydrogenase [Apibacter muscae]|uniref:Dihydrolipoyl dehydrogenase n=1 Tax=Apibacter muscae TaxID=2509004 RepID=A0A563DBW3_9FLAO|nr:dihydrolipoyl dehydrogenase [Apibacter muscae]TWP27423.1 dihydrolipoyl dehydrogenase [Apibacter muscae]TWP28839.1 dihydrolipoyl dehydrogenase [Apibacter muscae]